MINEANKRLAFEHAQREYPRECCGLVVLERGVETYHPCRNLAVGTDHFALHPEDYAAAADAGEILAVVHSHPNASPQPGQADKVACEQSGLPWHIVSVPNGTWASLAPAGYKAPLIGRHWAHGVLDCYSVIRDYYSEVLGVTLIDFPRTDEWWYNGGNLYVEMHKKVGFEIVPQEDLRPNDLIVMQVLADVPNHGAVYLGGNKMLHQLHKRLSCIEIYGGYWQKHTYCILRFTNADSDTLRRISETVWRGASL